MRDVLLTLIVFGSLLPAVRWPWFGAVMFAWVSLMNPHRLTWGFAYSLPVAMMFGLATLIGLVITRDQKRLPLMAPSVLVIMLALWVSFTTLFALSPIDAFDKWSQTIKILLMALVTMSLITTQARLQILVWVVTLSIGFFGLKGGLYTLAGGGAGRVFGPAQSFLADNNQLALALIMVLPLLRYLSLTTTLRSVRLGLYGAMALVAAAAIGSYSRGAFLAMSVMFVYMLLKSRQKVIILLFALLAVGIGFSFMPAGWLDRMNTIEEYDQDKSMQGRFDSWRFAWNVAVARPISSGGFLATENPAVFQLYNPDAVRTKSRAAHSIYFEVLGEHGFIGLGIFLALGLATLRCARRLKRMGNQRPDLRWASELGPMLQVSLVSYAVGGAALNLAFFDLYYYLIAIAVIGYTVARRALESEPGSIKESPALPVRWRKILGILPPTPAPSRG